MHARSLASAAGGFLGGFGDEWIESDRWTLAADSKFALPACEAVIVQLPAPVRWTLAPLTVQLPVAAKETGREELELALRLKSGSPKVRVRQDGKGDPSTVATAD